MCTTQFHFKTYNTHLFFEDIVKIGPLFIDEPRRQAISTYLSTLQSGMVNIAALQEVWWAQFAHELFKTSMADKSYLNRWCDNDEGAGLNPPGLLILGQPTCGAPGFTSYKKSCGEDPLDWSDQDWPVWKGRGHVTCPFTCSAGQTHSLVVFTTHMPVGYSEYSGPKCAFKALAGAVQNRAQDNPSSVVVLLGDLNIDYFTYLQYLAWKQNPNTVPQPKLLPDGNTEYQDTVLTILGGVGLVDDGAQFDPTYLSNGNYNLTTSDPSANDTWQAVNGQPVDPNQRIDYFMHVDSQDGTNTLSVSSMSINTSVQVTSAELPNNEQQYVGYQGSDHYPLEIRATITGLH